MIDVNNRQQVYMIYVWERELGQISKVDTEWKEIKVELKWLLVFKIILSTSDFEF